MKKIFLMTIVALCWLMMGSCSKGSSNNGSGSKDSCSESAEAAEAAAPGFENGVTYETIRQSSNVPVIFLMSRESPETREEKS